MTFGKYLKSLRDFYGFTQEEFARHLGVSTITVRQYESNRRTPNDEMKARMAEVFNIPFSDFMQTYYAKQAEEIVDDVSGRLQKTIAENGPMKKISTSDAINSGLLQIQFKSDDDHIAYLYSLLNDPGKFEASRCFFRHLDKESIPEVIAYLQQLASTPQYQKKAEE